MTLQERKHDIARKKTWHCKKENMTLQERKHEITRKKT